MSKPGRRIASKPEPLTFNKLYGKGIVLSNNNRQATRVSGFGDAIVFSSRTIQTFEKVFLKHRQKDVDWIGSLRLGFCLNDPQTQFTQDTLPNLAFKNLTDAAGYWLRACSDELLRSSPIIYVYYSFDGQICVGGSGQPSPQAVLTINEHTGPYYLFCEVYGRTDQIEIIDESELSDQTWVKNLVSIHNDRTIIDAVNKKLRNDNKISNLQYFNYLFSSNAQHTSVFYPTTKHNVVFTNNNRVVCVNNPKIVASYAFPNLEMKVDDVLICKIIDHDLNTSAILLFGLTTCNPSKLQNQNLPPESTSLFQQYSSSEWFIDHDINQTVSPYDELAFWFDSKGRVYLSINNRSPIQLKNQLSTSDINQTLYPFFDLYGQITSLCLFNLSNRSKLDFNIKSDARPLCVICCENLVDTQLIPCLCLLCNQCANEIRRPGLLSDCPFDKKHITQIKLLQ